MAVSFIYPHYLWFILLIPLTFLLALYGRNRNSGRRFWVALSVRCVLLLLVVLALAGIQLHLPSNVLTVVFVLDASDSISPIEQARGEDIIRQTIAEMPEGDQAAVILFGKDALVESLVSNESHVQGFASVPISTRTNISSALQLAMALFPDEGGRRIVLLSDGRENVNQAVKQAEMASMQDVEMLYIPLGDQNREGEVLLERLDVPAEIYYGQDFDLEIVIESNVKTSADLQVFSDDALIYNHEVELQTGVNRFRVAVEGSETGFHRYRARIVADIDNQLQNNEASAFTRIQGPASVLVVEGNPDEGKNFADALSAADMVVMQVAPPQMPITLEEMMSFDVVVLVNVPLSDLPSGAQQALPVYVGDIGRGLLVIGGDQAYGAGGYLRSGLEEILPVNMEVSGQERTRNLALVLAVDKSGSMGRCHCDNSDLNQTYTRQEAGQPKIDIAKEAIMRSANALGSQDFLGVVSFDDHAHWAYEVSSLPDQTMLENAIGPLTANGDTNMQSGMQAAFDALQDVDAGRKHVIMLTDGWTYSGDISGLVHKMNDAGITVSLVAAGGGSADYLRSLAEAGGGRFYAAKDMLSVPDIFLKETVQSVGEYIIEEPFYPLPANPSPIMQGLDETLLPPLLGYNGTTIKRTARLDLLTPRGDPLLASWQYGLGKTAVWTSDLKGQWAVDWLSWSGFSRFSSQLVGWLLPAGNTEGLTAQAELQEDGVLLRLDVMDEQDHHMNNLTVEAKIVDPELESFDLSLKQSGAGRYETMAQFDRSGTYMVTMNVMDGIVPSGQTTLGLVVPYSPEYRSSGSNLALLDRLATITGGGAVVDFEEIYLHNLVSQSKAREIWHLLLMIVALLFPIDVALRRISLTKRDWGEVMNSVLSPFQRIRRVQEQNVPRVFNSLFDAQQRIRQRQEKQQPSKEGVQVTMEKTFADWEGENQTQVKQHSSEEAMERLKAAKRRARKDL